MAKTTTQSNTSEQSNTPLIGKDLLKKVKELSQLPKLSKKDTAIACGYYTTKDDQKRVNLTMFYDAVLNAKGVPLDNASKDGRGRGKTYRASVHKNGQLVIGPTYTQKMGLKPGDEFTIELGTKNICLKQINTTEVKTEDQSREED